MAKRSIRKMRHNPPDERNAGARGREREATRIAKLALGEPTKKDLSGLADSQHGAVILRWVGYRTATGVLGRRLQRVA